MASPLAGSLAAAIYSGMKNLFLDATLSRYVVATTSPDYDPADPSPPTLVEYSCKAVRDSYSAFSMTNSSIEVGDSKILILVNSLAVAPIAGDKIAIQGASFTVIRVDSDPANAVWTCQGRQ